MANRGDLRLTVEAPACFVGEFRFTVLRRQYGQESLFVIVETGAEVRLHEAMAAAELAAERFATATKPKNAHSWGAAPATGGGA